MSKVTKRVLVEFEFEDGAEESIYIKDWWLRNHVSTAIKNALPHIRDSINNVKVNHITTNILPEEITVKLEDVLWQI